MKKAAKSVKNTAKSTATKLIQVPQRVGAKILSVPEAVIGTLSKKQSEDSRPECRSTIDFISREIIEEQDRNQLVRQSQAECMKEVTTHLVSYLGQHPEATYEEWIASLHPDNAEYSDGRIDHRFYVEDSDHRKLWNECMEEVLNCPDRIVKTSTEPPSYNRK